jgi:hypothetical protein
MALSEYQMTRILAQAMNGDVGEALRQYLEMRFAWRLDDMLDSNDKDGTPALQAIRDIQRGLEGMQNTLKMMKPE